MLIPPEQLIAHRGHCDQFPENSLLAIADAIAAGAKNIEFDIQLTGDGELVLLHDSNMQRMCSVDQSIHELSVDQLVNFHTSEPERFGDKFKRNPINLFSELLPLIKDNSEISFYMELKDASLQVLGEDFCFNYLTQSMSSIPNNLRFISFNTAAVYRAKQEGFHTTALVFRDWPARNQLLEEARADIGFFNYNRIPDNELIQANVPIMVYETCDIHLIKSLLDRGAAAVETFCIGKMLRKL
ncbi:MAG: glycerophosphoryl diester phosphodiesterase [Candidatus Endobugula sp.]|jgi:glycerophosphoryl diester phosphodiesterase